MCVHQKLLILNNNLHTLLKHYVISPNSYRSIGLIVNLMLLKRSQFKNVESLNEMWICHKIPKLESHNSPI